MQCAQCVNLIYATEIPYYNIGLCSGCIMQCDCGEYTFNHAISIREKKVCTSCLPECSLNKCMWRGCANTVYVTNYCRIHHYYLSKCDKSCSECGNKMSVADSFMYKYYCNPCHIISLVDKIISRDVINPLNNHIIVDSLTYLIWWLRKKNNLPRPLMIKILREIFRPVDRITINISPNHENIGIQIHKLTTINQIIKYIHENMAESDGDDEDEAKIWINYNGIDSRTRDGDEILNLADGDVIRYYD